MHPLIVKNDIELNRLCKLFHVSRLELFGSGANDDFDKQTSDLDFLVDFEDLQPTAYADAYLGLLEALGHLFQRPIDLVTISAVKNPYFLKSIERSRQLLYAA